MLTRKLPFNKMLLCVYLLLAVIGILLPGSIASPSPTSSRDVMQSNANSKESLLTYNAQDSQLPPFQSSEYRNSLQLQDDKSDSQLPSLIDELNLDKTANSPAPFEQSNHILAKRQVVRNDYERFYLCVFSLFTNPNCNQNQQNNVRSDYNNNGFVTNNNNNNYNPNYNSNYDFGTSSTTNTGFIQRPLPLFQGLFGQNVFGNRYQQNNGNNFYPYQPPSTYAPFAYPSTTRRPITTTTSPTTTTTTTAATTTSTTTSTTTTAKPVVIPDYPKINQMPYPDPMVNRRPGPESLMNMKPVGTSTTPTTTTTAPAAVSVTFAPLEKVYTSTIRLSFAPPSAKYPTSSILKDQQAGDQSQQNQQDEDTQIIFGTDKPIISSTSRITEKYDPDCVNDTSSAATTASPDEAAIKVVSTFPILEFGDILAIATTPATELNPETSSAASSKPPKNPFLTDPEYYKLKLKIQELERSNNALRVFYTDLAKRSTQLQKELNETIAQAEQLKKENSALKFNEGESQEQLVSFQTQTKYLQEALATVKDEGSKLKVRIRQLESTNTHLQQTNGQLQRGNSDQKIQINELKGKVRYLEDKVVRMAAENYAKHLMETRELRDKIKKLETDYIQCRNQVYDMQRKLQSSSEQSNNNNNNDFDFKKRVGLVEPSISSSNNSSEEIVIEAATVEDETERNTEMPTAIPGIVFQDEPEIIPIPESGENSTEVSSSETTLSSIVEFNLPSKAQLKLNGSTTVDLGNSTTTRPSSNANNRNETQLEILVLPDQASSHYPFGAEFTSEIEVPGLDPNTLGGIEVDPDFDVRIGDIGITGNGAITFGDDQGIEGGNHHGVIDGQSVYGQYPLFNVGQAYQSSDGHDSPWRYPFYPGSFSSLRDNVAYGQNPEFFRRQLK